MGCLSWNSLLDELPPSQCDLGWFNLKVASGVPSAISSTADECLKTLAKWVDFVHCETENAFRCFRYQHREDTDAEFRMLVLASLLKRELNVRYNQNFMFGEYDGRDACNLFLHGILNGRGGTCVSLPILYVVIGRRMGYPLRLAQAKQHLFCRWDDPSGERFNIEATSWGYKQYDDAYYRTWPAPIKNHEIDYGYIKSLTPREEAALIVALRGECYLEHLELAKAVESLHQAYLWHPTFPQYHLLWGTSLILHRVFGDCVTHPGEIDLDAITNHEKQLCSEFEPQRLAWAWADLLRIVTNWRSREPFPHPGLSIPHLTKTGNANVRYDNWSVS